MEKTYLGKFLEYERNKHKKTISEWISEKKAEISEAYYRDLENGRKLPNIKKAGAICDQFDLERSEFFYHLLKDILPKDVFDFLIKPSMRSTYDWDIGHMERLIKTYRKSYPKNQFNEMYEVTERVVEYLSNNFEMLPIIHFIYMRDKSSFSEIKIIMKKNKINKDFDDVLKEIKKFDLANIYEKKQYFSRYKKVFRIPRTEIGLTFKDRFFMHESECSKYGNRIFKVHDAFSPNNTFIYSNINCFDITKSKQFLEGCLSDLMAAFDAEETELSNEGSVPFYLSIVVSSREEYDIKNKKFMEIENNKRKEKNDG